MSRVGEDVQAVGGSRSCLGISEDRRWTTGRLSVLGSLRQDPFWPTRRPLRVASSVVSGNGRPGPLPPGPRGLPVIGSWIPYYRNPYEFLRAGADKYGDVFRVPLPLHDLIVVSHPDDVSYFMDDTTGNYSMFGTTQWLFRQIGRSVPTLEGEASKERRRMLLPMFGRRHLSRVADTLAEEFVSRIDRWSVWTGTGQFIDLQHHIARVTLPTFLRTMFSTSISEEEIEQIDIDIRATMRLGATYLLLSAPPNLIPFPGVDSAPRSLLRLVMQMKRIVRRRKENPVDKPDLLSILLEARYDDESVLSERDLIAELIVLIAGGYETIVAALSWTLALLLRNPKHLDRLYGEVDALDGAPPGIADLPNLGWLKACFDEGQRLQGAPLNWRFAMEDDEIGGYAIPRRSVVATSLYVVHRDPRWWGEDADLYDPMRFADPVRARSRPRLAFMPFGSGPHHCVGTGMAYMNAQFLLSIIFQRYRLSIPVGWNPQHKFAFSTVIKGGLPVKLSSLR
ncbi:cytochrome P450 [Mycobacteroides saopaulense]|uniref:cytochrome P450 n=1 Tax=Mycobacteroides saopaulense TaxID=1578165 RepID=UPI0009F3E937|nr:cytochrome P450 [Mycobacteroides saopaulense]